MQLAVGGNKQTYKTLIEISWLYYFIQSMELIFYTFIDWTH